MTVSLKATAMAHPNLALVKYWGKRDEDLMLPHQSSLSLTLAPWQVTTTVEFGGVSDEVFINGKVAEGAKRNRVVRVLQALRLGRELGPAKVVSVGNFPEAAGFASSAAAFAALAVAARAAAGLAPNARDASLLARLGSGSACRSVQGGTCVWYRGDLRDGRDSFASQVFPPTHWPSLRMVVAVVSSHEKKVSSKDGMRHCVETSPFYAQWVMEAEKAVPWAETYIRERDLPSLGKLAEDNAWRMHATAMASSPALVYMAPETLMLLSQLQRARQEGLRAWATWDAGPNPVFLCEAQDAPSVVSWLKSFSIQEVKECSVGGDAQLLETHLF